MDNLVKEERRVLVDSEAQEDDEEVTAKRDLKETPDNLELLDKLENR